MIVTDPYERIKDTNKYTRNGVVVDSFVLAIFFLNAYVSENQNKKYVFTNCNIEQNHIKCLNSILQSFRINTFIVTPHIFTEFINKIKNNIKGDYKEIKRAFINDFQKLEEISISKNSMITHTDFIDFGVDISLLLATEEQIKNNKHTAIMSFDSRFISKFFDNEERTLAINLEILRWFY